VTKVPILASYAYLRETDPDRVRQLVADPRIEFLLDSGAFTAFNVGKAIDLQDYIAWVHAWKSHLFGYMALDVLQDTWRSMCSKTRLPRTPTNRR
jgi:hypothetical protein